MVGVFKVAIVGGRDFNNYNLLERACDNVLSLRVKNKDHIIVVSGKASGADTLGEHYAKKKGYEIKSFPAKWTDLSVSNCRIGRNKYGVEYNMLAGPNRNKEMADYSDAVIAFWDGKSTGTKNMIELTRQLGKRVRIIRYKK